MQPGHDNGLRRAAEPPAGEWAAGSGLGRSGLTPPVPSQRLPIDATTIDEIAMRLSDAVAERVIEVMNTQGISPPTSSTSTWLDAQQVAQRLGVSREWVYQHADELGCIRLGGGRCPRLRFDPRVIRERLPRVGELPSSRPTPRNRSSSRRGGTVSRRSDRGYELLDFDREP